MTSDSYDLTALEDIGAKFHTYPLVKLHGCLMTVAWILSGSIGVLVARFYKTTWATHRVCGVHLWFAVRKLLFCGVAILILYIAYDWQCWMWLQMVRVEKSISCKAIINVCECIYSNSNVSLCSDSRYVFFKICIDLCQQCAYRISEWLRHIIVKIHELLLHNTQIISVCTNIMCYRFIDLQWCLHCAPL